jgi:hypothetical protein
MDAETRKQLTLVKDELELVLELLERERKELHAEIHQTDSRDYRSEAVATARSGGPADKDFLSRIELHNHFFLECCKGVIE